MKLGIIGDAHLGCADYTDKRRADFAAAFINAIDVSLSNGAEAICLLGDVFDSALMRRNVEAFSATIREVGPVFTRLKREQIPVLAIAGNHEYGRGREAGELGILESLEFLRVLRGEEFRLNRECAVIGFPWHAEEEVHALHRRIRDRHAASKSGNRVLLLHNFVRGSKRIPAHLAEIEQTIAEGFDRVFVGHHHDAEEVGAFVMPGATEVQNLAEADQQKSVVVYDMGSGVVTFHKLPKTRDVVLVERDTSKFAHRNELFDDLTALLAARDVSGAFVCIRLFGEPRPECIVTKADVVNFLRTLNVHDRFVDVRTRRPTRDAAAAVHGVSIDARLRDAFRSDAAKAERYLKDCTDDSFPAALVEKILR